MDPAAAVKCLQCQADYPLLGPLGVPSLTCPKCGWTWNEECCKAALKGLEMRRQREAPQPTEAETRPAADTRGTPPPRLDDVIGNPVAVLQIRTALDAYRRRLEIARAEPDAALPVFPHVCFSGPAGLGKSFLARIIGHELHARVHLQMGQSLNSPAKVCEVLRSLKPHDVLFVDEIHGLKPQCQETFYLAMEDGVMVPPTRAGKAASESKPIHLPPFTLIGATTDEDKLLSSLQRRFKYQIQLRRLTAEELAKAIAQRAAARGISIDAPAATLIGVRALGRPGEAVNLLDLCADVAMAGKESAIDTFIVERACEIGEIDSLGLRGNARRYLRILESAGGTARLNVMAARMDGMRPRVVELKVEPDLVFLGLIEKGADGRHLTPAGRKHLREH